MINTVTWVICPEQVRNLYYGNFIDDAVGLDSAIQESLLTDVVEATSEWSPTAAQVKDYLKNAEHSGADVDVTIWHSKPPFKAVEKYDVEVYDLTAKDRKSINLMFSLMDRDIEAKAVTQLSKVKDAAASVVCSLIVNTEGTVTESVMKSYMPPPEHKMYLVVNAVAQGDSEKLEELFISFEQYDVSWNAVSGFVVKQIPAMVACMNAPRKEQKEVALSMGVSSNSVQFFLRSLPRWNKNKQSFMMWVTGWLDVNMKSGVVETNPGLTKSALRVMSHG